MQESQNHRTRIRGLDGLRALAVIAVVTYHLWPALLPGGFIGVDVFFVLSGYLITRSFRPQAGEGPGARLARFWHHRVRRIVPPLAPVILVTAVFAGVIGRDVTPGLWLAVIGAITFSSNWIAIAQSTSYFTGTSAHPLQHLWSLAVEEQFYLVWPLLLLLIGLLSSRIRPWVAVGVAAISATAMIALFEPGTDPTAVYVGTGTHLFGLGIGAALALYEPRRAHARAASLHRRARLTLVGAVALVALIIAAFHLTDDGTATYRGGLAAVSAVTAALIWSVTRGEPGIGRLLDLRPLRALGRRSYAVYLWHWPAVTLLNAVIAPRSPLAHTFVGALTVLLTLLAASASWRWIEQPILLHGWRRAAESVRTAPRSVRYATLISVSLLTISTGAACWSSTQPSEAKQLITAGQQYLRHRSTAPTFAPSTPTTPLPTSPAPTPMRPGTVPNPINTPAPTAAPTTPLARDVTQTPITAVGDSVMLAAAPTLQAMLPNVSINAEVSRQPYDVAPILRADAATGSLADTVLVGIGTNGSLGTALPNIRAAIGPNRTLVLVTAHGDRPWIPSVDDTIRAYAATSPNTKVADWNRAIASDQDLLANDGIHPGTAGARIYVQAIVNALKGRAR